MSWFPLSKALIRGEEFRTLAPSTKAFYLVLISEKNLHEQVRKSDALFASMLNVSVATIKRARNQLKRLGWIRHIPGYKENGTGKGMVSQYPIVKHAIVKDLVEGDYFAECDRATFEGLLWEVSEGRYDPADLVTWSVLEFWHYSKQTEEREDFFITDQDLIRISGFSDAPDRVRKLAEFEFKDGTPLFIYRRGKGSKFIFEEWTHAASPDDDENMRREWERRFQIYQAKASEISEAKAEEEQARNRRRSGIRTGKVIDLNRRISAAM